MSRKREKREGRLIRGDELLEARGIDLDAPDEILLPALAGAIGADPDSDLSVADWLGSIALEESARRLIAWEKANPLDKDLKRTIRASLFRLQQRGIAGATREKPAGAPVRIIEPVEPTGYLSPLDGAGNRLAWLSRPRPEGGLIVLSSMINDRSGMRQIDARLCNKAQLREIFADAARHSVPLVAAPHRYVDWLMYDAYKRGVPREDQGGGYPLLRAEFYLAPASPVPSPLDGMMPALSHEEEGGLLDGSAHLFDEPEFKGWALPEEMVKVHQARFRDAQDSTLVLSKQQMTERLTAIIDQAFEEVVGSEARALYAARMREMALWYLLAQREEPARLCRAVGSALAQPERRLKEVSFLRALAFRSFVHLLPEGFGEDQEARKEPSPASPLILRPD